MPTEVSIAVYKGKPLDAVELRSAAIYLKFEDGEERVYHLAGANPSFKFATEIGNPTKLDLELADVFSVSVTPVSVTKRMVHRACADTPIHNDFGNGWNSQDWVAEALSRLVSIGCMSEEQQLNAINLMIDVCLEARV